jgi:hypothetical protein
VCSACVCSQVLSSSEFTSANVRLGIAASAYTSHSGSYSTFFTALNTNGDGGVSQSELAGAVTNFPQYETVLINAFTNNATSMSDSELESMIATPQSMLTSTGVVRTAFTLTGTVFPGQRAAIKTSLASTAGVPETDLLVSYTEVARRRQLSTQRKLQSTATTRVEVTYFVRDDAQATSVMAALPTDVTSLKASVPTLNEFTVSDVQPASADIVPSKLPMTRLYVLGGILVAALAALIGNACFWAKKNSKAKYDKGGCCSANALKPWLFAESIAAAAIGATVYMLYTQIKPVTNAIIGILNMILDDLPTVQRDLNYPALNDFVDTIPSGVLDSLRDNRDHFEYLDEAVLVPGLLAAIFLAFGFLCPLIPVRKGSLCFSKIYMMLAFLLLVLALVFYIIFASAAIFMAEAPDRAPELAEEVNRMRGLCVQIPISIQQRITDANTAISTLQTAGQNVTQYTNSLNTARSLHTLLDGGCTHLTDLLDEMVKVFVPAMMCIVAIVFAIVVNQTLCCAAGGICRPRKSQVISKTPESIISV